MNDITFIISPLYNPVINTLSINSHSLWVIIALLLLAASVASFIYNNKKKQPEIEGDSEEPHFQSQILPNAVYVFGDFVVYDRQGNDISHRVGAKLRALFAIIFFSSLKNTEGISTVQLSSLLWPDRNASESKNIRGVTINHLRNIISEIDGIELVHRNNRWLFVFSQPFYCDFIEVWDIINNNAFQNKDLSNKEIDVLRSIVRKGTLFPDLQLDWIDRFKNDYENLMEDRVSRMIRKRYKKEDYASVIQLSDIYFAIDPINEEILDMCIRSLKKMGKIKQARFMFDKFCRHYEDSMGEAYTRNLLSEK